MTAVGPARRLDPDALADLEEQRSFLLRSLDDLERERAAGDIDAADYETLRDDYTHRAAEVIRAIDEGKAAFAAATPARRGGWPRRVATVALVAVFAVGAGVAVAQSSGTRLEGETLTGEIRQTPSSQMQRAAQLAQDGEMVEALQVYDAVLADEPDHLEALTERGLLLVSIGQGAGRAALVAEGRASIEQALEVAPEHPRALFYLGLALRLQGDRDASDDAFDRALAADPPAPLRQDIERFRASTAGSDGPPPGMLGAPPADGDGPGAAGDDAP